MKTGKTEDRTWRVSSGLWDSEPDWSVFDSHGFNCATRRNGSGAWCGYVLVPDWHPLHGHRLDHGEPVWLEVHGGVTWSAGMSFPEDMEMESGFVVGFDCAHSGDTIPAMVASRYPMPGGTYCTFNYVVGETNELARQISEYSPLEQLARVFSGTDNEEK